MMKKSIAVAALVVLVGFAGSRMVEARGDGNWGPGYCNGPGSNQLSEVDQEAYDQFYNDTLELREQLFEKRSEYFDAMNEENPDKEYAAQIWSEMFDLKQKIQEKAEAAGIEMGFGNRGKRFENRSNTNRPCGGGPGSPNCWTDQNQEN